VYYLARRDLNRRSAILIRSQKTHATCVVIGKRAGLSIRSGLAKRNIDMPRLITMTIEEGNLRDDRSFRSYANLAATRRNRMDFQVRRSRHSHAARRQPSNIHYTILKIQGFQAGLVSLLPPLYPLYPHTLKFHDLMSSPSIASLSLSLCLSLPPRLCDLQHRGLHLFTKCACVCARVHVQEGGKKREAPPPHVYVYA